MPHKTGARNSRYENKISLSVIWALFYYFIGFFFFLLAYVKVAFQASVGIHGLYIFLNLITLSVKNHWEKSSVFSFLQALLLLWEQCWEIIWASVSGVEIAEEQDLLPKVSNFCLKIYLETF